MDSLRYVHERMIKKCINKRKLTIQLYREEDTPSTSQGLFTFGGATMSGYRGGYRISERRSGGGGGGGGSV